MKCIRPLAHMPSMEGVLNCKECNREKQSKTIVSCWSCGDEHPINQKWCAGCDKEDEKPETTLYWDGRSFRQRLS